MRVSRAGKWKWTMALGALLLGGFACNDHGLNPFSSVVRSAAVDRTEQGEVRPVDILFVVDSSNSMCEEQAILEENFDQFISILADANADFNLAVISTDMVDFEQGVGKFHTAPGTYQLVSSCTIAVPDTSNCPASVGPVLNAAAYRSADGTSIDVDRLRADFRCMALTGIDGDAVEMGLAAMRAALSDPGQQQAFLRPNALLSIVFVTDENDCSDGTNGGQLGEVYSSVIAGAGDTACEFSRNAEDSCLYAAGDTLTIDPETGRASLERNLGSELEFEGTSIPAREWCVQGSRGPVEGLAGQLELKCEGGGAACGNALVPRNEYYNFLVDLVAAKNYPELYNSGEEQDRADALSSAASDIIVATILNTDGGVRYNSNENVPPWCGVGVQGYRYQAFAEMFPQERRIIAPICDLATGNPTDFAPSLTLIAETIGKAINSVCLQSYPMACTADADCPQGQTCTQGPYLAANPTYSYSVCSGFTVRVEEVTSFDEEGRPLATNVLEPGVDYTINHEATNCLPASPLEISFARPPATGAQLVISYPRAVSSVF